MDTKQSSAAESDELWRRVLYRWFIQYNPLYLVSAALVLVGVILLSRGLTGGGTLAQLGITTIAEVYAWSLVGGAALLYRIHLRRPAVMLALLAAVYQCDLTLHTETCAYLGIAGALGSAGWLVSFVGKLRAIAWAMQLRVSRSAQLVAVAGASFIAGGPWLLRVLDGSTASSLMGAGVFILFAAGLWTHRRVETPAAESGWPATVARRSLRATWIGWAVMVLFHVAFWVSEHRGLSPAVFVPVAALLGTRWVARESTVWLLVVVTLGVVGLTNPELMSLTALLAAATLILRALRQPWLDRLFEPRPSPTSADVYRQDATTPVPPPPPRFRLRFIVAERGARRRLLTGAGGCVYLALWTIGWSGGPWPAHLWWLDLLLAGTAVALWARARVAWPLLLPVSTSIHLLLSLRIINAPTSALQWGIASVGVGFALLMLSLVVSVRWRHRAVKLARVASASAPGGEATVDERSEPAQWRPQGAIADPTS